VGCAGSEVQGGREGGKQSNPHGESNPQGEIFRGTNSPETVNPPPPPSILPKQT
ncbi:unnamed protein product, partial [Closterium sp. NIES-53]